MKTMKMIAAMAIMMAMCNTEMYATSAPRKAPKPAPRTEIRHEAHRVHHTNYCLHEMNKRKHDKHCQCDCHYPVMKHVDKRHIPAPVGRPVVVPGRR